MQKSRLGVAVSVALLGSVWCGVFAPAIAQTKATIGLVFGVKGDSFYVTMVKGARHRAAELGISLIADGPSQWNAALQTPIVDAMIARRVDGLIVVPNDPQAMIAPLQRAFDAGIPVATTDQYIGNGNYTSGTVTFPVSYIASDNFAGGRIACDALIKAMGDKGTLYIQTPTAYVPSDTARRDGCKEAIKATNGAVTLSGVDYNQDSATTATSQTQAAMQRDPRISGIFGTNLFSAQGAAAAVKTANLVGVVKIANFDAPQQAIDDLKAGAVDIVIAQTPAQMGELAVQAVYDAINNAKSSVGKKVATPYVIITRANVDTSASQAAIYKAR